MCRGGGRDVILWQLDEISGSHPVGFYSTILVQGMSNVTKALDPLDGEGGP